MWERRCLRHHVLRVVRVEGESTPWGLLPEVSAPISGPLYASDTRPVASEGLQNLTPVRSLRICRVAWLNPLANLETDCMVGAALR